MATKTKKYGSSQHVFIFGALLVVIGLLGYIDYFYEIFVLKGPQNPTLFLVQSTIFGSGWLAIVIANCLEGIEKRIEEIEKRITTST